MSAGAGHGRAPGKGRGASIADIERSLVMLSDRAPCACPTAREMASVAAKADAVRIAVRAAVKVIQRGPMSVSSGEIGAMARLIETLMHDAFGEAFAAPSKGEREGGR